MTDVETNAWVSLGSFLGRGGKKAKWCLPALHWLCDMVVKKEKQIKKKKSGKWHSCACLILLTQMHISDCSVAMGRDNLLAAWLWSAGMWQLTVAIRMIWDPFLLTGSRNRRSGLHSSLLQNVPYLSLSCSSWKHVIPSAFLIGDIVPSLVVCVSRKIWKCKLVKMLGLKWWFYSQSDLGPALLIWAVGWVLQYELQCFS